MVIRPRYVILGLLCLLFTAGLTVGGFLIFRDPSPPPVSDETTPTTPEPAGPPYEFDYSWATYPYIAHAFGGILGNSYTNSREAFLLNYQLGHRLFEVDFDVTTDNRTVLAHDADGWRTNAVVKADSDVQIAANPDPTAFTYDNFMSSLWYDKYHPLDIDALFQLLQEYPDIYIITGTKYFDEEHVSLQFSEFVNTAKNYDEGILNRFIPQIYHQEMLDMIMNIYPWKSVIYTLYSDPDWTPENVLEFATDSGVKFITMWGSLVEQGTLDLWKTAEIKVAAHTINNLTQANRLRSLGVSIIYTDFLLP